MKALLFKNYRRMIEQAWIPIFVDDALDTEMLLEGCRRAGLSVIEYTLRRRDAHFVTPTLKERFPDLVLLMGSTIDADEIVKERRRLYPQLMTVKELAPYVDGLVSMLPYSDETLRTYAGTHLCIPTAESGADALRQIKGGACFVKILGPDLALSRRLHAPPTFDYCPTYITGGVTVNRMEEVYAVGNLLSATGFDVILRGLSAEEITAEVVAERLRAFAKAAKSARDKAHPLLCDTTELSDEEFLQRLPNYCGVRP